MKKYFAIIMILLAVSVFAQTAEELIEKQQNATNDFARNWLSNYESIIWISAMIMAIFVAILYFAGNFFQNEQIKQLGRAELMQAAMTVLIVGIFLGFVQFVDVTLNYTADQINTPCLDVTFANTLNPEITSLNKYAACYVNNLHKMAVGAAKGVLRESVDYASQSYTSVGGQSDSVWLGYLGYSQRPNANLRLDSEIKRLEFSTLSGYITSLNTQADLLGKVIPILGPSAILLGLILRAFFFTRKLGGLLLATGFSLLIVLPSMYLLAWYTMQVQVYGPQAIEKTTDPCPDSCKVPIVWGYNTDKNSGETLAMGIKEEPARIDTYGIYSISDYNELVKQRIENGLPYISASDEKTWSKSNIQLCFPREDIGIIKSVDSQNCPAQCRVFPMAAELSCNESACDEIPLACKTIKPMTSQDEEKYCDEKDEDSEFYCNCPDYCEIDLPQVKESADVDNPTNIVPTLNANAVTTGAFDCSTCPSQCRAYVSDVTPYITTHDGQGNICDIQCKQCMEQKTDGGQPDLMYGIPSIRSTRCDDESACGISMSIKEAQDAGITTLCPTECRINFADSQNEYKDPVFLSECENTYKDACERCSTHCKINATDILAGECEDPPKYYVDGKEGTSCTSANNCEMDEKVNYNCARCPEPCRYINPDSINYKIGVGLLYSSSHYYQQCIYSATPISCETPCIGESFKNLPGNWNRCNEDEIPAREQVCSPYESVYKLFSGQPETCPSYIFPPKTDPNQQDSIEKELEAYNLQRQINESSSTTEILVVSVQANPTVASVCANEDAQTFCQDEYCSDTKCKVSRSEVGPDICYIDISNPYSQIIKNDEYCGGCYELNSAKTTGPQCQVYLSWGGDLGAKGILPAGCSQDCDPTTANPKSNEECVGFCYPRLVAPSINNYCEEYDSTSARDDDREVETCAACPIDCRYDYKVDANGNGQTSIEISQDAAKKCGLVYTDPYGASTNYGIVDAHNCDLKCRGLVPPQSAGVEIQDRSGDIVNFYTYCTNDENYDCESRSNSNGNGIWVRDVPYDQTNLGSPSSCYYNVVDNSSTKWKINQDVDTAPNCPDEEDDGEGNEQCDNNWYDSCPGSISYTYHTTNNYHACSATSQYEGVDDFINGKSTNSLQYYECGTIHEDNDEFNLCGDVGDGQGYVFDTCSNSTCNAQYNTRAVECLEGEYYSSSLGTSTQSIGPDQNCNECPYFCRPAEDGVSICNGLDIDHASCASPTQCDLRTSQDDEFANPRGYCSIGTDQFNLQSPVPEVNSASCAYKQPDEAACPLRCRINLPQNQISVGCSGGEVGNACQDLNSDCKADIPDSPCLPCSFCGLEQCTQQPRVWTDCSMCSPENFNTGATAISPSDLVSSLSGAAATNTSWRTIGALGVPAIVLPILAIITTIAFIRSLSPLLGGDIEIPGLMKLI